MRWRHQSVRLPMLRVEGGAEAILYVVNWLNRHLVIDFWQSADDL